MDDRLILKKTPNLECMQEALPFLMGRQDFECFSKVHTDVKTFYCNVIYAQFLTDAATNKLIFRIEADRFLRNMVRAIVGTLLEIGYQRIKPEDLQKIIEGKSRSQAGSSVPACGLYLTQVRYPNAIFTA